MGRLVSGGLELASIIACALVALAAVWAALFHMWATTAALVIAAALIAPRRGGAGWFRWARFTGLTLLAIAAVTLWRVPVQELSHRLDALAGQKARAGADGLSPLDCAAVYGLNLGLGVSGYAAGFPERARQSLWMAVPGDSTRRWHSDFAMRSPRVRAAVYDLLDHARTELIGQGTLRLPEERVAWRDPGERGESPRVALAGDLVIRGTAMRGASGLRLDLVARAEVAHPRTSKVPLLGAVAGRSVVLDEGLFWVLQERDWLHPYAAEWVWSVREGDPALSDLSTPVLDWGERLWLAARAPARG